MTELGSTKGRWLHKARCIDLRNTGLAAQTRITVSTQIGRPRAGDRTVAPRAGKGSTLPIVHRKTGGDNRIIAIRMDCAWAPSSQLSQSGTQYEDFTYGLALLAARIAACSQQDNEGEQPVTLETTEQRLSYGIAYGLGERLKADGVPLDAGRLQPRPAPRLRRARSGC